MTNHTEDRLAEFYLSRTHANLARVPGMWLRTLVEQAAREDLPYSHRVLEVIPVGDRTYALLARMNGDGDTIEYTTYRVCPRPAAAISDPKVCLESGRYGLKDLTSAANNLEARAMGLI